MTSLPLLSLILAVLLDRLFGEPPDKWHPTVWIGNFIAYLDKRISSGLLILIVTTGIFTIPAILLIELTPSPWNLVAAALVLTTTFSWRGLSDYTMPIKDALDDKDLIRSRSLLPYIAGRDPSKLDEKEITSAVVESIAESSVDSVIAPFFFFLLMSISGLSLGIGAAVLYRALNTMDSMLARPGNPKGWAIAKADEILNLVPARLGAIAMLLAGLFLGRDFKRGLHIFRRDRNMTKSRNGGQTMSAMAGLLGVELIKKGGYLLGSGMASPAPWHIKEALRIVNLQIILFTIFMVIPWIVAGS